MITVLDYIEQAPTYNSSINAPSITTFPIERLDDKTRELVIDYMLNYDFSSHFYIVCSCDQDVFTELYYFPTFHHPLNDGVYR